MLADLTSASFEPHLESVFRVPEAGIDLVLEQVSELGPAPSPELRPPFSLTFTGPPEAPLDQRIHRLVHPDVGELAIFLVPIGAGRYEAVFS